MSGETVSNETAGRKGTCPACERSVLIVNHDVTPGGSEGGYLGRHWRPGTRRGTNCRGSFGPWVGKLEKQGVVSYDRRV